MVQFVVLLAIYGLIGTVISILVMRARPSQEDYFLGGRAVGWIVSAMTYAATTYSAFMMVGLVGLSYATGVGALIFEMAYLVATLILLSIYGARIWEKGREKGFVSPMEMFSDRYGSLTGTLGAVVAFVALIPYTSVQVIGLALIFQNYEIGFTTGILVAAAIICVWTMLGGLRGVAITDALQGAFMIGLAVVAVVWCGRRFGGVELSTFPNKVWTPVFFVNLTLPWCFFALTNPQVVQRLFILKNRQDLRKMLVLFGVFGFLYTAIVTIVGFAARFGTLSGVFPQVADRDTVIVNILGQMGRWLALPLALTIIFAAVSTANSIILTLASMLTRDVLRQKGSAWFGRLFILVLTVLVVLFSLTRPNYLVELSVSSSRILMVFLPLFLGLFHLKEGGRLAGILTLAGGGGAAILFGSLGMRLSSVWTLVAAFGMFFLGAALDKALAGKASA